MVDDTSFRKEILKQFAQAERIGCPSIDINAGDLHRALGDYPRSDGLHRMPVCCGVMYEQQKPGDEIVFAPPKGKGASLTIRYRLPRI